jgi:hypothetical protein
MSRMNLKSSLVLLLAGLCVGAWANQADKSQTSLVGKEFMDDDEENGEGKLYFTGTGYTINLIPQAIILGVLAFLAVYFLGLDLFGSNTQTSGYGAPTAGYGAPAASYGAPAASYGAPEASYGAPAPSYAAPAPSYAAPSYAAPAAGYDAPSSGYTAAGRYYAAADGLGSSFDDAAARRKRSSF